jgi:signal transduction histidine kinase
MGIVSNILFGILSTIAILKHQLLDIQLLVRRGTTYLILAGLAAGTYSLIFLLAYHLAGGPEFRELYFFTGLILVVAIAASFQPAVQWMSREVDRFFFQERWKPLRELQRFAQETKEITDISALARSLLSLTADAMKARGVYLLGPPLEGVSFSMGYQGGRCEPLELPVSWENPLMVWLNHQGCAVSARDLQALPQWQGLPSQEQKALLDLEGELFVPLKSKDSLVSLLVLGPKVGRKPYSQEEISLLETVAYQAATVIENAMLYEQLRRRLEELQRTQDQLIRSAKLAAVGELAASVAHEVNNPLQTILNITYLLAQDSTSEQVREDLKLIEKEVLRARGIVRSLLDFAHRGEAAWGLEDVNKAVESVLSLAKVRTEASGITVATNLEPALPPVWADGEQLKQVFLNIVTNALDAMPNGGTLTVTTRRVNDRLVVEFSDTGVGIPEEFLSRVFEPFFTTKPAGKGTGLGLAVSQSIVERHGGDISVRSQVGRGSTFTVSLPVSQDSKEV